MLRNQEVLDDRFKEVATAAKTLASQIITASNNNFVDDELRLILTTISEGLGTHLEILEALRSEIKTVVEPS
jgi:hypothetical protein